jgi:hypothetical protein
LKYLRHASPSDREPFVTWKWTVPLALAIVVACLGVSRQPVFAKETSGNVVQTRLQPRPQPLPEVAVSKIWPVEHNKQYDLYSNGLRIDNTLAVANEARSYLAIARTVGAAAERRSEPAGIVFHMTESPQESFEPGHAAALRRIGEGVLQYVRNNRSYHFVIDRFGQVHRIVEETDAANHAGNSVWADSQWTYLDLNTSFVGVAFEGSAEANEPQTRAARLLVEMLRSKYDLRAENCITHSQVSVNPGNMRIGWHTDWGTGFPFHEVGLPDNYEIPNPALYLFGFEYDQAYVKATGPAISRGLALAEQQVREGAEARGVTVAQYRKALRKTFTESQQ